MINISVIVPHYNTPELLAGALDHVPKRDDIEIIVVDDKSNKDIEVFEALTKNERYSHVQFLHNTTDKKGAGVCRNIGLKRAQGKWLLFLDADDFFVKDFLERVKKYIDSDYDLIYFMPTSVQLDSGLPANRHLAYKQLVDKYLKNKDRRSMVEMIYTFVTPWSKMIKREIVEKNSILFDETPVANDVMFMTKCAAYAKKITADKSVIYCVTRANRTLTTKKDVEKFDIREQVFLNRFTFLKERLTKKELSYVNLDRIAISHILNALMGGYGARKAMGLLINYVKNGIPLLDAGLFNPVTLASQAKTYFAWRIEDKKYQ